MTSTNRLASALGLPSSIVFRKPIALSSAHPRLLRTQRRNSDRSRGKKDSSARDIFFRGAALEECGADLPTATQGTATKKTSEVSSCKILVN